MRRDGDGRRVEEEGQVEAHPFLLWFRHLPSQSSTSFSTLISNGTTELTQIASIQTQPNLRIRMASLFSFPRAAALRCFPSAFTPSFSPIPARSFALFPPRLDSEPTARFDIFNFDQMIVSKIKHEHATVRRLLSFRAYLSLSLSNRDPRAHPSYSPELHHGSQSRG